MNKNLLSLTLYILCTCLNSSSFALDKNDIGEGVEIVASTKSINTPIKSNNESLDRILASSELNNLDLDNDGLADNVFVISYNNSSKFKSGITRTSLLSKNTLVISNKSRLFVIKNIKTIKFSDQKPKNETYALVVQLSSKSNRTYILTQPGFFPETKKQNLSFAVNVVNKNTNEYSSYENLLKENNIDPESISGGILEISGCVPGEDSCEGPIIGAYWNGRIFKSIWGGVMWN